jgi:hypothetical protein
VATCTVWRKGGTKHTQSFSQADAQKAGLWGKSGPWTQYPKRMLQMRARGFALRSQFADALAGLITREEAEDMPQQFNDYDAPAAIAAPAIDIDAPLLAINEAGTMEDLLAAFTTAWKSTEDRSARESFTRAKDARKKELEVVVVEGEADAA